MTTASAKQKGRLLQQTVARGLTETLADHGILEGDFRSVSMGSSEVDIILSPAAKKLVGDLKIECKNCESLAITTVYHAHAAKYPGKSAVLISKRNGTKPIATISLESYLILLKTYVKQSLTNISNS